MLCGVILITLAACAPFFRYVDSLGDEGVLLHGAVRILRGDVLYRDFFGILPPAGYVAVAGWMKVCGTGILCVRGLAVAVIAGIGALIYVAACLSSGSRLVSALAAIGWAVLSQGPLTVVNHHWFTTAASMASGVSLLLLVDRDAPRRGAAFASGLFAGVASMVTTTRGALLCLGVFGVLATVRPGRHLVASAALGMALAPTAMFLHVAASDALAPAVADVVMYPSLHYARIQALPFGSGVSVQDMALVALFPLTLVLTAVALARQRGLLWHEPRFRVALVLAVVGGLGSYPRPDHVHLVFTAPLVCPLLARLLVEERTLGRTAIGSLLVGLGVAGFVAAIGAGITASRAPAVSTARGVIKAGPGLPDRDLADLLREVDGVPPGSFFFYPYAPLLPYLTGRRHAAALDVLVPGYTTAAQFRETCARVVADADWVVVDRRWTPGFFRRVVPALSDPHPPEKRRFEAALRTVFDRIIHRSGRFELRGRSKSASGLVCDGI